MGELNSVGWNSGQIRKYANFNFRTGDYSYKILLTGFGLTQNGLDANGKYTYWNNTYIIIGNMGASNAPTWTNPNFTNPENTLPPYPDSIFYLRAPSSPSRPWTINQQNYADGSLTTSTWYNTAPDGPIPRTGWQINTTTGPGTPSQRGALGGTPGQIIRIDPDVSSSVGNGKIKTNSIISNGLVLRVASYDPRSYVGSGNIVKDISKTNADTTLSEISFWPDIKGFEMQDVDASITFNRNFSNQSNNATFFVTATIPNASYPSSIGYNILSSIGPVLDGYYLGFYKSSSTQITLDWGMFNSYSPFGDGILYSFPTNELPKKIYLCGVMKNNIIAFYINGIKFSSKTTSLIDVNFYSKIQAGYAADALYETFPGLIIHDYLVYNRGLSDNEVLHNYNILKLKSGPPSGYDPVFY